jgi:hypothetical protein
MSRNATDSPPELFADISVVCPACAQALAANDGLDAAVILWMHAYECPARAVHPVRSIDPGRGSRRRLDAIALCDASR